MNEDQVKRCPHSARIELERFYAPPIDLHITANEVHLSLSACTISDEAFLGCTTILYQCPDCCSFWHSIYYGSSMRPEVNKT